MKFKPAKTSGGKFGIYILVPMLALLATMLGLMLSLNVEGIWLPLLILALSLSFLALVILYYIYGFYRLYYEVDGDGMTIGWAFEKKAIPFSQVTDARLVFITGGTSISGAKWPGLNVGNFSCSELGRMKLYATDTTGGVIAITTDETTYGITPADPERFLSRLWMAMPEKTTSTGQPVSCEMPDKRKMIDFAYHAPNIVSMVIATLIAYLGYSGLICGGTMAGMAGQLPGIVVPVISATAFIILVPMSYLLSRTNRNAAVFLALSLMVMELILLASVYTCIGA